LKYKQDGASDKNRTTDNIQNIIFVLMYPPQKLLDLMEKLSMLSGSLVTTPWRVLRWQMEETPSR
jgi:hypothetical protein